MKRADQTEAKGSKTEKSSNFRIQEILRERLVAATAPSPFSPIPFQSPARRPEKARNRVFDHALRATLSNAHILGAGDNAGLCLNVSMLTRARSW